MQIKIIRPTKEDEWLFQFVNLCWLIQEDKYLEKGSVGDYILDLLLIWKYIDYLFFVCENIFSEFCKM